MSTIRVASDALRDEETAVRVEGFDPGETVTLVARSDDWYEGGCESRTTFEADDDGVVDTGDHAPVDGSYDGVAPMGWLWSMMPDEDDGYPVGGAEPVEVTLAARVDGEAVAEATTVRRPTAPAVTYRRVDGEVVGDLFVPPGDGPHPGVLVLHGSDGKPNRGVAALLAAHGVAAFALRYFGEPEPVPDDLAAVPVEYFDAAATWLRDRESVAAGPVGLYGISKGAEAALVVGARYDWSGSVVAVAPAAHRWQGLDESSRDERPSWTADGDPLPFVPFRAPPGTDDEGNVVLADVYAASLDRTPDDRVEAAEVPVGRIDGEVLLVAGGDDRMWPSEPYASAVADRLADREAGGVSRRTCADAGHGIAPPYRPTAGTVVVEGTALGGTPAGNARAAADYWSRALDLLADDSE